MKIKLKPSSARLKPIPNFKNENEERAFWATHSSVDYVNWSKARRDATFPNLKLSTRTVSIRLPEWLIASLKTLANKKDVPYQSLVKIFLAEKLKEENKILRN